MQPSHEAEGDRELSSAEVRNRGRRPRILTTRDNVQSRSPSAKCCNFTRVCITAFASRCVYYFTRWGHGNRWLEWLQLLLACGWWAERGREYRWREAQWSGTQPRWGPGAKPRRGARWAEPPDCHGTNLKCFMNKFCHEMRHDLWR